MGWIGALIAVIIGSLALFEPNARSFLRDMFRLDSYLRYENCYFLFLLIVILLLMSIGLYGLLAAWYFGAPLIRAKAAETMIYLIFLLFLVTCIYFTRLNRMRSIGGPVSNADPEDVGKSAVRQSWHTLRVLTLNVARVPVAFIAGLPPAFMILLHTDWPLTLALLNILPVCLVTMAGFTFNDIFDCEKDRRALANKPLALGLVRSDTATAFAWSLALLSLLTSAATARGHSFSIIVAALVGVIAYSWWAQRVPVLKGPATAILCCTPFAYGAEVAAVAVPPIFYAFLLMFITGRELLLDVKDFAGDLRAGIRTLVAWLHPTPSRILGWALMLASVVLVTFYVSGNGRTLFLFTLGSLLFCLWLYMRNEALALAWSRVSLLAGVTATSFSI
jgi:4-hydroxybenzoate polyprenyltransferase